MHHNIHTETITHLNSITSPLMLNLCKDKINAEFSISCQFYRVTFLMDSFIRPKHFFMHIYIFIHKTTRRAQNTTHFLKFLANRATVYLNLKHPSNKLSVCFFCVAVDIVACRGSQAIMHAVLRPFSTVTGGFCE